MFRKHYVFFDHLWSHRNRSKTPHQILHIPVSVPINDLLKSSKVFHKETRSERINKYYFFVKWITEPVGETERNCNKIKWPRINVWAAGDMDPQLSLLLTNEDVLKLEMLF